MPHQAQQVCCVESGPTLTVHGLADNAIAAARAARGFGSFGIPDPKKLKK